MTNKNCYRCGDILVFSEKNRIRLLDIKIDKIVCNNCLSWYRSGGIEGGHVELPFLMTTYDINLVLLFDRFMEEDKME
jgi:hypothetical protein